MIGMLCRKKENGKHLENHLSRHLLDSGVSLSDSSETNGIESVG